MKKILFTLVAFLTLTFCAHAQTFRVGPYVGYTTSNDKYETVTQDGGDYSPGVTASILFREGKKITLHVRGDVGRSQIPTLFTTDEGAERPEYELRLNPEARAHFGKFFAGAGLDTFYQGGLHNEPGESYTRSFGVNPTVSAGIQTTKHEIAYTYLLRDKGTDLYGHRVDYFYSPASFIRVGFQANYLTFKERNREGYIDPYYENDVFAKASIEFQFKRGK